MLKTLGLGPSYSFDISGKAILGCQYGFQLRTCVQKMLCNDVEIREYVDLCENVVPKNVSMSSGATTSP